jgi:hypothetical protein
MRAGTSRQHRLASKFRGASAPLLIYASLYALVVTVVILSEAKDLLFHADSYF